MQSGLRQKQKRHACYNSKRVTPKNTVLQILLVLDKEPEEKGRSRSSTTIPTGI